MSWSAWLLIVLVPDDTSAFLRVLISNADLLDQLFDLTILALDTSLGYTNDNLLDDTFNSLLCSLLALFLQVRMFANDLLDGFIDSLDIYLLSAVDFNDDLANDGCTLLVSANNSLCALVSVSLWCVLVIEDASLECVTRELAACFVSFLSIFLSLSDGVRAVMDLHGIVWGCEQVECLNGNTITSVVATADRVL